MSGDALPNAGQLPRWLAFAILLGLYLTLRGYHSFDGDQAYRLPLLLHQQDPRLFAGDPFVRALDAFNPHRGWLLVLDLVTRPLGPAAGLFLIFVLTFAATCHGLDRLARAVWPTLGHGAGLVAVGLVLAAKAGNVGTNHLFEAMVLDRQVAFALGWLALAQLVVQPDRGRGLVMAAIGVATLVHPSAGLQLALMLGATWTAWCLLRRWTEVSLRTALPGLLGLAVAVIPGLAVNLGSGPGLLGDIPTRDFWLLSVELQSPQHMLPHLWRMPQWLAFGCYLVLGALAASSKDLFLRVDPVGLKAVPVAQFSGTWPATRLRLALSLAVIVAGLAVGWYAIEGLHLVRATVFQPFRMATVARGIALVFVAGRIACLWQSRGWLARMRAILLVVSVGGDWLMVVVTLAELAVSTAQAVRTRLTLPAAWQVVEVAAFFGMLGLGWNFLGHHDTESGHIPLLAAVGAGALTGLLAWWRRGDRAATAAWAWSLVRRRTILALSWAVPAASLLAGAIPLESAGARHPLVKSLVSRCRFAAVPVDDVERLALWCRDHTPISACFIGPPGPKTFRLWSQRSLAFNRAGSPYHAAGLADWFARFADHVGFHGQPASFVRSYLADRHGFEARFDRLSDAERAALARRQGADYIVGSAPGSSKGRGEKTAGEGELELLHVEGHYAVYRVKPAQLAQRQR